jgi:hypothetical protein
MLVLGVSGRKLHRPDGVMRLIVDDLLKLWEDGHTVTFPTGEKKTVNDPQSIASLRMQ